MEGDEADIWLPRRNLEKGKETRGRLFAKPNIELRSSKEVERFKPERPPTKEKPGPTNLQLPRKRLERKH